MIRVAVRACRGGDARQRIKIRGDELDIRRDADRAEHAPTDGAEEGLDELRIRQRGDLRGELAVDLPPQRALERRGT